MRVTYESDPRRLCVIICPFELKSMLPSGSQLEPAMERMSRADICPEEFLGSHQRQLQVEGEQDGTRDERILSCRVVTRRRVLVSETLGSFGDGTGLRGGRRRSTAGRRHRHRSRARSGRRRHSRHGESRSGGNLVRIGAPFRSWRTATLASGRQETHGLVQHGRGKVSSRRAADGVRVCDHATLESSIITAKVVGVEFLRHLSSHLLVVSSTVGVVRASPFDAIGVLKILFLIVGIAAQVADAVQDAADGLLEVALLTLVQTLGHVQLDAVEEFAPRSAHVLHVGLGRRKREPIVLQICVGHVQALLKLLGWTTLHFLGGRHLHLPNAANDQDD